MEGAPSAVSGYVGHPRAHHDIYLDQHDAGGVTASNAPLLSAQSTARARGPQ